MPLLGQAGGNGLGQPGAEQKPHLGELYADVGLEFAFADGVEQVMVNGCGGVRFSLCGDILAQRIESNKHPLPVEGLGHAQGVADLHTGHKPGTELAADSGALTEVAQFTIAGK